MKSSETSFLRNCISGWNVRSPDNLSALWHYIENISIFASRPVGRAIVNASSRPLVTLPPPPPTELGGLFATTNK